MLLPILISKQARLNADVKSVLVKGRVDDVDGPALDLNSVPRRIWYQRPHHLQAIDGVAMEGNSYRECRFVH